MKKLTILVDMDGVLANYQAHLLATWEKEHPEKFAIAQSAVTEHDIDKLFPHEYRSMIEEITLRERFFASLPPIAGGREALEDMLSAGHNVRICTAPKKVFHHCIGEKFEWVNLHLGKKWIERIVLTRDKTLVHGDILIDDKPCITGSQTPVWEHVFYDQPYNRHITTQKRLTWKDYREVLGL